MNWKALRSGLKYRLYTHFPPLKGKYRYFGQTIHFAGENEIIQRACMEGIYEHENLDLMLKLLPDSGHFYDIGANLGLVTAAVLANKQGIRATSFEPSPNTFKHLKKTAEGSLHAARWNIQNCALGDVPGTLPLCVHESSTSMYDGFYATRRGGKSCLVDVQVQTLDHIWNQKGCPDVVLLKIDVEGAEIQVLKGASNLLEACHSLILVEWNRLNLSAAGVDVKELWEWCGKMDYALLSVPKLTPITSTGVLKVHMLWSEYFLLVPQNPGNKKGLHAVSAGISPP